ncbi:MAG: hypothetical protein AB8B97_16165 [Granulosicoccus sp.]
MLCAVLSVAAYIGGWTAVMVGMVVTSAVADATAMLAFTSIQLRMPSSLQAQAASLWYSFVLTSSTIVIFLTGFAKGYGFAFMVTIATIGTIFDVVRVWRGKLPSQ